MVVSSRLLIFAKQTGLYYSVAFKYFVFSVFCETIAVIFIRVKQCFFSILLYLTIPAHISRLLGQLNMLTIGWRIQHPQLGWEEEVWEIFLIVQNELR